MKTLELDAVAENMILGKAVYVGRTLVCEKGSPLTQKMIGYFRNFGITTVSVLDEQDFKENVLIQEKQPSTEVVDTSLKKNIAGKIENLFYSMENQKIESKNDTILDELFFYYLDELVDSIHGKKNLHIDIIELKSHDSYTYCHSVNVAVLSLILGNEVGLSYKEMQLLSMSSLLHDVGKMYIPKYIINKNGKLSDEELFEIKKHPAFGAGFISRQFPDIDQRVIQGILQHHEKMNGSGYPYGLSGSDICLFARIIAICDIYDALTSKRSYHDEYLPSEAIEHLYACVTQELLDYDLVKLFVHKVYAYPAGVCVELSNGEIGIVTIPSTDNICRPTVLILEGSNKGDSVDLMRNPLYRNVVIVNVIHNYK